MHASLKAANGCIHTHIDVDIYTDRNKYRYMWLLPDTYSQRCGGEGNPSLADLM